MKKNVFIGIDIGKKVLDCVVKIDQLISHHQIENKPKTIKKFLSVLKKKGALIIGMENTGRYNFPLYEVLSDQVHKVYVISPLHIKKSLGLIRGKNDRVDAQRIMSFIEKNHHELEPWRPPSDALKKLKIILTERKSRIKMISQLKSTSKEYAMIDKIAREEKLTIMNEKLIESLGKQVTKLEETIEKIISQDEGLSSQSELLKTVPGIGKMLCWTLLAKTENFKLIRTPRKLACYSGVVPFDHQSGSSIRGRNRVSKYADQNLKTLLHMGAMSAIRLDNDLSKYYKRKVEEGKNKMSVLNAVRNKIIHRAFAVIRNQKPYADSLILS